MIEFLIDQIFEANLLVAMCVAAIAGLVSFFSPCVIPLVPGYLSYASGMSDVKSRSRVFLGSVLFVSGFTFLFVSYGVLFGGLGSKIAANNQTILEGVNELTLIKKYFSLLKFDNFIFDPTVVRGLEYYTGPIFEANLTFGVKNNKGEEIEFGSIGGGGRYDDLVKRFNNQDCPSTGISVGLDRLIYVILQKNKIKVEKKNSNLNMCF